MTSAAPSFVLPATVPTVPAFTLTADQEAAYQTFVSFILDPNEEVFVLEGYAGTGKTTLVQKLLSELPGIFKTWNLINNHQTAPWDITLSATTHKACEALQATTNYEVVTIHSLLGLRVNVDHANNTSSVVRGKNSTYIDNTILFIDEASFIDSELLSLIFDQTRNCKIIFIGDPAQLTPVNTKTAPVFVAGFTTASLKEVVRQKHASQIQDVATAFRDTVIGGRFPSFTPNQTEVLYLDRQGFEQAIEAEYVRSDWSYHDSKILAWTNKCVENYNRGIRNLVKGSPHFVAGDYAINNQLATQGRAVVKNNATVLISSIRPDTQYKTPGFSVSLHGKGSWFMPETLAMRKAAIAEARGLKNWALVEVMESSWIDLRPSYASTINKSQGSTFKKVFIDLDDVRKCRNPNQMARLLYVAVTRASEQVYMTGDIV